MPLLSAPYGACVQVSASWLALDLGAAVSRGGGVPELCPHLANCHVEARCGHSSGTPTPTPLLLAAPRPSASQDCGGGGDLHTSAVRRGEQRHKLLLLLLLLSKQLLTRASQKR